MEQHFHSLFMVFPTFVCRVTWRHFRFCNFLHLNAGEKLVFVIPADRSKQLIHLPSGRKRLDSEWVTDHREKYRYGNIEKRKRVTPLGLLIINTATLSLHYHLRYESSGYSTSRFDPTESSVTGDNFFWWLNHRNAACSECLFSLIEFPVNLMCETRGLLKTT